jgi:SAM-dependent methyltransferase
MSERACRLCAAPLEVTFCDLGMSPLSNAFVKPSEAHRGETFYPLHAWVCGRCFLVQLEAFEAPERIFSDYVYFSSYSDSWLDHSRRYADAMGTQLGLGAGSLVIEVASNDGYLLQYFKQAGVPVLGIEPARNVAQAAEAKGIPTLCEFFGRALAARLAREGRCADLVVANNVMAHVPDLNDFVAGLRLALKPTGVLTIEVPHLLKLIEERQFDTIYHEHFSYFSFTTARRALERHGLAVHDVEQLPTHGGSLRVHAAPAEAQREASPAVTALLAAERAARLDDIATYGSFAEEVKRSKHALLEFLIEAKRAGKRVAGYGAPAKGNTLLNYCGIRADLLDYTVDRSPHKQGLLLPGTRIPVFAPEKIMETRPDYVLILPWNLQEEIRAQMSCIREWGGRFVLPVPRVEVLS